MSLEENKALARRSVEEIWGKGNLAAVDEFYADDFVWHWAPPGVASNRGGYKQFVTASFAAFSDVRCPVEDIISEGDKVVVRWTWLCTHTGEYMGIAPTDKQITVELEAGQGLPATAFFNAAGERTFTKLGPYRDEAELVADIDRYALENGEATDG